MGVIGFGGYLFRSPNPAAAKEWYRRHLNVGAGCVGDPAAAPDQWAWMAGGGAVAFEPFAADSDYFPADRQVMLNFRVSGIDELLGGLRAAGIAVETREEWDSAGIGRFARIHDLDGNPIELWEPAQD